ncbi:MAG: hypothetical protein LBF93_13120 [Zoogloeaceae bacterium]|jgi:hypothetical protein|nr:hypothetical protein [Zoogloeaceae bacterium]
MLSDKQFTALGIVAIGAAAALYVSVRKPGQSLASSVGGAVVGGVSDVVSGAFEAAKDTALGQGVTDIVNHHEAMSLWDSFYWGSLSADDTWDGEERSGFNAYLNAMTLGTWGAGWFGLFD